MKIRLYIILCFIAILQNAQNYHGYFIKNNKCHFFAIR